jgi:2-methylcitrate dehydratase PrpD
MSIMEELVRNVLETRFESLDKEIVDHAKNRITDWLGCLIGGADAPGCRMIVDLVKEWGGREESTILIHGGKAPAHNVAMVNSVMARSFDFEPVQPYVMGIPLANHVSGTTVPTALAIAEQKSASGKELITALVLGDDLISRITAASDYTVGMGWDSTGVMNMFGATAIAGRLWGLDEHQLLNAFGIVVNQMAGTLQSIYDGTHSFKLVHGLSARAGIFSAKLAGKGFTGVKDPLLSKYGYFALYCRTFNPEILTKNLGKKFYADGVLKPYPCCRANHGAIDCILELVHKHDIRAEDIDEVIVDVSQPIRDSFIGQPFEIGDVPQVNATFSLQYNVANALLRKSVRLEHFTEGFIRDPKVADLTQRVKIISSKPPELKLDFGTKVEVKMKYGEIFSARVDVPKGDIVNNPLTKWEIIEKFRANVTFSQIVAKENAEKVVGIIERLEDVKNVVQIIKEIS